MHQQEQLVLASASPRRREFFAALGLPFRVSPPDLDEKPRRGERPAHYARRLAEDKAAIVAARLRSPALVVAADTIVVLDKKILQKPRSPAEAARMLRALSGKWHAVISGLCVQRVTSRGPGARRSSVVRTAVLFKRLTEDEISAYISTGEPMDKAGAYAIQGIGAFMVRAIRGSYTNVVGLPLAELVDRLERDFGVRLYPGGLTGGGSRNRLVRPGDRNAGAR